MRMEDETLRALLLSKPWVGFDLDDTLHEFRRASTAATAAALAMVERDYDVSIDQLREQYSDICSRLTNNAFVDGGASQAYRRERFGTLLVGCGFKVDDEYLERILAVYKATLGNSLRPMHGARKLLDMLRSHGKKIVIITEGPEDAQLWTVQQLGIADKIDHLATSNRYRVSKTDGLFGLVMDDLNIPPSDLVFIGDSMARDILPAASLGVSVIHLAEEQKMPPTDYPRVQSLEDLVHVMAEPESSRSFSS